MCRAAGTWKTLSLWGYVNVIHVACSPRPLASVTWATLRTLPLLIQAACPYKHPGEWERAPRCCGR